MLAFTCLVWRKPAQSRKDLQVLLPLKKVSQHSHPFQSLFLDFVLQVDLPLRVVVLAWNSKVHCPKTHLESLFLLLPPESSPQEHRIPSGTISMS